MMRDILFLSGALLLSTLLFISFNCLALFPQNSNARSSKMLSQYPIPKTFNDNKVVVVVALAIDTTTLGKS